MRCLRLLGIPAILVLTPLGACAPGAGTLDRLTEQVADLSRKVDEQQRVIEDLTGQVDCPRVAPARPVATSPRDAAARSRDAATRPMEAAALPKVAQTRPAAASAAAPAVAPDPPEDPAAAQRRKRLPVVKVSEEDAEAPGGSSGDVGVKSGKAAVLRLTGAPAAPGPGSGAGYGTGHGAGSGAGSDAGHGAGSGASSGVGHGAGVNYGAGLDPALVAPGDRLGVVPLPDGPAIRPEAAGPEEAFRAAKALLAGRKLKEAAQAFSRLTKTYPRHALADDAAYALAECAILGGQHRRAAWLLRGLLRQYPSGNKAPAALFALSGCEERLGRGEEARKVLAQVVQLYPKSPEAALASRRIRGQR